MIPCPNSFIHPMLRVDFIVDSQMGFSPVLQPHQHLTKTQLSQVQPPTATPTMRQHLPMQPHPHVPQDQRYSYLQQTQQRIPRTRPNPCLVHLTVTRLDGKPTPVRLLHPRIRRRTQRPSEGIHQRLTTMTATLATTVATLDTYTEACLAFTGAGHGVLRPTALLA